MKPLVLVHWNETEARERLKTLRGGGYRVNYPTSFAPGLLRSWSADPPLAFVIDLTRLPSHGRDVALAIRERRGTRHIPIVFAGGEAQKVARIQRLLPDAIYSPWEEIGIALERAVLKPPVRPIVPASRMAGYAAVPLVKKLGIKEGSVVSLVAAPHDFSGQLKPLPRGVHIRDHARGHCDVMIVFVNTRRDLERRLERLSNRTNVGSLWLAWRKQSSGVKTDVTQQHVRAAGLASGLVDFKICAVDDTWSALRFAWRKK